MKKVFNPTGFSWYTNMAAVSLFYPPIWPPWRHVKTIYSCHEITGMDLDVMFFLGTFLLLSMEGNNLQFKLLSLNVRGIRTFEKRKCIFNWLEKKMQISIFFRKLIARRSYRTNGGNNGEETYSLLMEPRIAKVLLFWLERVWIF